jgi:hypothetical protein
MLTIRIVSYIGMIGIGLFLPFWFFILSVFLYALFFTPYELLVLSVLIDAQFGNSTLFSGYAYTMVVGIAFLTTSTLKPYIRFYR